MSSLLNYALYYPSIEFSDYTWLWTASLLWDRIYRIQPEDYTPDEPESVKILSEEGEIGIPLNPKGYAKDVAQEFIANLDNGKWNAAAFERKQVKEYTRIHPEKIDVEIRKMLVAKGTSSKDGWLYVPDDFASLYMTYLAKKIAQKNSLQLVSDKHAAWTALTYYGLKGIDTEFEIQASPFALAALIIGDHVPSRVTDITPQTLLKFRRQYRDERQNFMRAMKESAAALANCHDPKVLQDTLHDIQMDVRDALKDYNESMAALKIHSLSAFSLLAIPISTSVLSALAGLTIATGSLIPIAGSIAIGLIAGISKFKQGKKRLDKDSNYSYLIHAATSLPKIADISTIPHMLHQDLNEFVND